MIDGRPTDTGATTLLRGGWAAVWDGQRHRIVERGEVAMRGDRILYAGHRFPGQADRVIDRPGWFICPGFINLHGHIGVEVMAAMVDIPRDDRFAPSPEFSRRAPVTLEPSLTPEEQRLSAEFSLVQMLRCGATTIVDAGGSGPIWWLGNPPDDEEFPGRDRRPRRLPRLSLAGPPLRPLLPESRSRSRLALGRGDGHGAPAAGAAVRGASPR